jgi:hypothetical protein
MNMGFYLHSIINIQRLASALRIVNKPCAKAVRQALASEHDRCAAAAGFFELIR